MNQEFQREETDYQLLRNTVKVEDYGKYLSSRRSQVIRSKLKNRKRKLVVSLALASTFVVLFTTLIWMRYSQHPPVVVGELETNVFIYEEPYTYGISTVYLTGILQHDLGNDLSNLTEEVLLNYLDHSYFQPLGLITDSDIENLTL